MDMSGDISVVGGLMKELKDGVLQEEKRTDHSNGQQDTLAVMRFDFRGCSGRHGILLFAHEMIGVGVY
jgi:hypothetical protein